VNIAGRTALLTGATGGLGQAIARELRARGARLVLSGRRAEVLDALADEVGGRALVSDLASPEAAQRLADEAGDVDVLVANAGLPASGRLETFSAEQIDRAIDVNLRAPVQLARALLPGMLERGVGQLVFVSSINGKLAPPGTAVYSATKFALRGFALALRQDLHGHGVGVSTVFPGFVREAGMWADAGVALPRGIGTSTPQEIARAVIDAIERDRGEVDVAPAGVRLGARLGGVAPGLFALANRLGGGAAIAERVAEAQRSKR
jgi:NADP-dependent 3-hydroxy acid dehydrogenase YdfG